MQAWCIRNHTEQNQTQVSGAYWTTFIPQQQKEMQVIVD